MPSVYKRTRPKQIHCKLNGKVIGITRKICLKRLKYLDQGDLFLWLGHFRLKWTNTKWVYDHFLVNHPRPR